MVGTLQYTTKGEPGGGCGNWSMKTVEAVKPIIRILGSLQKKTCQYQSLILILLFSVAISSNIEKFIMVKSLKTQPIPKSENFEAKN